MHFIIDYTDAIGTADLRIEIRPLHRDHIYKTDSPVKIVLSGPTTREDGRPGTMLVVEAEEIGQVKQFAQSDPYVTKGVVEQVAIRTWNWVLGKPASPQ